MKESLTKKLNEQYPELFLFQNFRSVAHFHFECGDGWYNILDSLCSTITSTIRYNNKRFNELMEAQDMINNGYRSDVPEYLLQRIASLNNGNGEWPVEMEFPVFAQVKEKFGTLSVYTKVYDEQVQSLIDFAERMSKTTCEECGNVGQRRDGSWIKTLCYEHHEERETRKAEADSLSQTMIDRT